MNVKNRKCIKRLSWRSLWGAKNRNIIAIIAIALTTLMFTSLFTIGMSINSTYEMYSFRQAGGYCHGTFNNVTDEQLQRISEHPIIKATGKRIFAGFIFDGDFEKTQGEISYMDDNCAEWSFAKPVVGHSPKGEKDIAMDTKALSILGVKPELGAKVELTYIIGFGPDNEYEKTDTFNLVGWWEYDDIGPAHFINVSEEYIKKIEAEAVSKGLSPFDIDLNIMTLSSINIRGQMEKVAVDTGYSENKESAVSDLALGVNWGYTASQLTNTANITTVIAIQALLALVVFTGYLIIYNIFQISVNGDIRFYGLLKTIGVTPRQLSRIIRQQALSLCVIGIPIGLLLGYIIGVVLTPMAISNTSINEDMSTISTSPIIFIASTLFALITVILSCRRPGKIAGKVSPVEATKYTEVSKSKKKSRNTRGAKVYQMAFANLGRHKSKTFLVVVSLSLSVVLLNLLVTFTNGFDIEKYLEKQSCADFIVSSTDYFSNNADVRNYISEEQITEIKANTQSELSGCAYTIKGIEPITWISEEYWRNEVSDDLSQEIIDITLSQREHRNGMIDEIALIEGLDKSLFEKLTVVAGDITPVLEGNSNSIAMVVYTDDYGNIETLDKYPEIGTIQNITYVEDAYYIDNRTGERADDNTPLEFMEYRISESNDVEYTISAYVTVPNSMSYRYTSMGYSFVLPVEKLKTDSKQEIEPLLYLFDTANKTDEESAESYLATLTSDDMSGLMYESKSSLRENFKSFQNMFLLMGGLLCAIIGIVGILNFFNAIMTSILSRKREFAVLQAVGMTNKQLKTMLVYEGLFYALSSALIALILSVIMNPLIAILLGKMFWFFSANFTVVPFLIIVPIFALLGWLIPSVLYKQTSKHSVVERLREN